LTLRELEETDGEVVERQLVGLKEFFLSNKLDDSDFKTGNREHDPKSGDNVKEIGEIRVEEHKFFDPTGG
jgi:hypothetical protein